MKKKEQEARGADTQYSEPKATASTDEAPMPTLSPEDLEYAAVLIDNHRIRHGYKWSELTMLVIERRYLRLRAEAERLRQQRLPSGHGPRFKPMVTQDYQDGYKKGAADCAGSLARLDEMERQRDAAWLECRRLRDALIGLRALVKAEFPSLECVDIDRADSALSGGTAWP